MENPDIKILIVDDSIVMTEFLSLNLPKSSRRITVAGMVHSAPKAKEMLDRLRPDVVTLDIEMPQVSGLNFLLEITKNYKVPIILVSTLNLTEQEAKQFGAAGFVMKPSTATPDIQKKFIKNLSEKIISVYDEFQSQYNTKQLKGIKANSTFQKKSNTNTEIVQIEESSSPINKTKNNTDSKQIETLKNVNLSKPTKQIDKKTESKITTNTIDNYILSLDDVPEEKLKNIIVAIGASTGGTETILSILKHLPENFPATVITQHMPKDFTKMYAERLNRSCPMHVSEARDGDLIDQGNCLISPGGELQTRVEKSLHGYKTSCRHDKKYGGHRPSVDVLFNSIADNVNNRNIIGIILTGMGRDGAEGLLRLRQKGAFTVGQDEKTSVVYGMPMVAYQIGAVEKQAPLHEIPNIIINHIKNNL